MAIFSPCVTLIFLLTATSPRSLQSFLFLAVSTDLNSQLPHGLLRPPFAPSSQHLLLKLTGPFLHISLSNSKRANLISLGHSTSSCFIKSFSLRDTLWHWSGKDKGRDLGQSRSMWKRTMERLWPVIRWIHVLGVQCSWVTYIGHSASTGPKHPPERKAVLCIRELNVCHAHTKWWGIKTCFDTSLKINLIAAIILISNYLINKRISLCPFWYFLSLLCYRNGEDGTLKCLFLPTHDSTFNYTWIVYLNF